MRSLLVLLLVFSVLSVVVVAQNNSCAGTAVLNATKEIQYLTTPNYESDYKYPPFLDCRFVIKAPDKMKILLDIIDMEMEPRIFDECADYVSVSENLFERNTSKITVYCESLKNRQYISTGNAITVSFQSDELVEYRGVRLSYRYYDPEFCPPGWKELSDGNCVKLEFDQKTDWIRAQNRCMEQQSNLAMIGSVEKTSELEGIFNSVTFKLWIGYNDATTEGKLLSVDYNAASSIVGRDVDNLADNNDENDCMTLQFGDNRPYRMDSCASYNGFICEMKKNDTTELYVPPIQDIQDGSYSKSNQYTLWLLLFLIGLVFLTFLAFLCFMCWKQKDTRVHTEAAGVQQNAFMSDSRGENSRTSGGIPINSIAASNASETNRNSASRSSPVTIPIENNRPPKKFPIAPVPNRLPMAEENSETEPVVETAILSTGTDSEEVSAVPKPQPRTLPPMPTREGTFHSLNTKDGSTLRTRRNKELFERPIMHVLDNVSAISLDEFWSNKKP